MSHPRAPRRAAWILVSAMLTVAATSTAASAEGPSCDPADSPVLYAATCGNVIEIVTVGSSKEVSEEPSTSTSTPQDRYQRHALCMEWYSDAEGALQRTQVRFDTIPDCADVYVPVTDPCPGQTPLEPLWVSRVLDPSVPTYGPWQQITGQECPADPLLPAIIAAWQQMSIEPQAISVTPDYGWAIAGMGVSIATEDAPQTTAVTILGTPVMLRATPVDASWAVTEIGTGHGDTATVDTSAQTITFDRREHRVQLGLTTTWEGHYSLDGGASWIAAPGNATTTTAPQSLHVFNPRTRLVNCDTQGTCASGGASDNPFTLTDPDADGIDNHLIPDQSIGAYLDAREAGRAWTRPDRVEAP